jgi:hypothetical protein
MGLRIVVVHIKRATVSLILGAFTIWTKLLFEEHLCLRPCNRFSQAENDTLDGNTHRKNLRKLWS